MRVSASLAIVCALVAGTTRAQSGPWADGEIIVQTTSAGQNVLYRINPDTGHGVLFLNPLYWGGGPGSMAFDSYRNGLVLNVSLAPDGWAQFRFWVVQHDGTKASIPGLDNQYFKGVCPIGDGRIYYQRILNNPNQEIGYVDAANNLHTLLNASGTAPFSLPVEHVIYHAPSNALIATNSGATAGCGAGGHTIHRIPLSADGTRVGGPVTCTSVATGYEAIIGIDRHPSGSIFVTVTSSYIWYDKLITVDPNTLAVATWAQIFPHDLNGGFYSARLGRAVVLNDLTNELRTFGAGDTAGYGVLLATDVPVGDGSTGTGPGESMFELDVLGPGCNGWTLPFGTGLAGSGGFVPALAASGCVDVGSPFSVNITNVVGGGTGKIGAGVVAASLPIFGGTLYVDPVDILLDISALGPAGTPGAGSLSIPVFLGDPGLIGVSFYVQAGFFDAGAVQGFSLTNGLRITIG